MRQCPLLDLPMIAHKFTSKLLPIFCCENFFKLGLQTFLHFPTAFNQRNGNDGWFSLLLSWSSSTNNYGCRQSLKDPFVSEPLGSVEDYKANSGINSNKIRIVYSHKCRNIMIFLRILWPVILRIRYQYNFRNKMTSMNYVWKERE